MTDSKTTTISHWLNNNAFAGSSTATAPVTNPATGAVTGEVALASVEDARTVIEAANAAFPAWRDTSLAKRTTILFKFRELLNERKGELAALITAEHGKVLSDALGEVSRGQEEVEFLTSDKVRDVGPRHITTLIEVRDARDAHALWPDTDNQGAGFGENTTDFAARHQFVPGRKGDDDRVVTLGQRLK